MEGEQKLNVELQTVQQCLFFIPLSPKVKVQSLPERFSAIVCKWTQREVQLPLDSWVELTGRLERLSYMHPSGLDGVLNGHFVIKARTHAARVFSQGEISYGVVIVHHYCLIFFRGWEQVQ